MNQFNFFKNDETDYNIIEKGNIHQKININALHKQKLEHGLYEKNVVAWIGSYPCPITDKVFKLHAWLTFSDEFIPILKEIINKYKQTDTDYLNYKKIKAKLSKN